MATQDVILDFGADPSARTVAPPPRRSWALPGAALVLAAAGAVLWWTHQPEPPVAQTGTAPGPARAVPAPASAPGVRHPLEFTEEAALLAPGEWTAALGGLLGREAMLRLLLPQDFPRRFVATVDALGREHAPPLAWPVQPTPGRFAVEQQGGATVAAGANAQRYAPLVDLLAALDAPSAGALYRRMYPLFQQAYGELGFGERYFNDRMVEVIDLLLATPRLESPPQLALLEVKGPVPSLRPWVRYEFTEPRLQALAAGQKILLRLGPQQQAQVQQKLAQLRAQLVQPAAGAAPAPQP